MPKYALPHSSLGLLQHIRRSFEELSESILVDAFLVGLFGRDPFFCKQILNGVVQGLHADVLPCLHGRGDLKRFGVPDEIADGWGADQDLQRRAASFLINSLKEVLRDDDAQRRGEGVANLRLLRGREDFDDAVDRLGGILLALMTGDGKCLTRSMSP